MGGAPVAHAVGAAPPLPQRRPDPGTPATWDAGAKDGDTGAWRVTCAMHRRSGCLTGRAGTPPSILRSVIPSRSLACCPAWSRRFCARCGPPDLRPSYCCLGPGAGRRKGARWRSRSRCGRAYCCPSAACACFCGCMPGAPIQPCASLICLGQRRLASHPGAQGDPQLAAGAISTARGYATP